MKKATWITSLLVGALVALPAVAQPGPGMGGGMGPGMGQGMGPGMGQGKGPGRGDGMGPGMGPGMDGGMGGMGGKRMNCAEAKDPKVCEEQRAAVREARDKAREQCKGKTGPEHKDCMRQGMIESHDCTKAPDPAQCNARKAAHEACKDKTGAEQRSCMHDRMPPPDCSKAPNPANCQQQQKAFEACKGKPDPRACMREQRSGAAVPPPAAEKKQ